MPSRLCFEPLDSECGTHNVLYVATMNDKVYAFDADTNAVLWTRDFTNPSAGITAVPIADIVGSNALNIVGNVGVESTPVIDLSTATMYLLARTLENGVYVQRLHALDITAGTEKFGEPVAVQASVSGQGYDAVNGAVTFNPRLQNQRSGLALVNGMVLLEWGSHEDIDNYHGWVMAYGAADLRQSAIFCSTPDGHRGGIWQSGRAPVIDPGGTPDDYLSRDASDGDLGSSGPLLIIPNTNLLVSGGKDSILYLLNLGSMGHEMAGNTQIVQSLAMNGGEMLPGPAYWNSPAGGLVYIWA
jgi:hypothetical protein